MTELTNLGRCPTCGQHRWQAAMCRCTHAVTVHRFGWLGGKRVRKGCWEHGCTCAKFEEVAPCRSVA